MMGYRVPGPVRTLTPDGAMTTPVGSPGFGVARGRVGTNVTPGGTSGWVASATHTFGGLPEGVLLYFRVRARDAFDHRTEWANVERTTCDASPPSVPYLASEPLFTKGTTNQLTWSTAIDTGIGGVQYRIQATSDPTWTTVEKESTWLQTTSHTFSGLADGSTYYYRVQARDDFSWTSTWSPVVSSPQDASAPPVPVANAMPAHTEGLDATVSWGGVTDAGGRLDLPLEGEGPLRLSPRAPGVRPTSVPFTL